MAIHLHRSNSANVLVEELCAALHESRPADPFQPMPIVVGSRGMERWLRHEIATRSDIAAGIAFPFPRQALAGAGRWLLEGATDLEASFWELTPAQRCGAERWDRDPLTFQLVALLRRRADEAVFDAVSRYLSEGSSSGVDGPVSARELLFASEVADVLDRLMHDRPEEALGWAAAPDSAPVEHRWLAFLLSDLGADSDVCAPPVVHRDLLALPPRPTGRTLCVFGLSTMGPGDRSRLEAIARSMDVHLFALAATVCSSEALEASDNPLLTSLGAPGRDLQAWLDETGHVELASLMVDPLDSEDPALLARLQAWVLRAGSTLEGGWSADPSVAFHSAWGALRQCEILRDELLARFAADPTLEPRDVVVMTPDIETYAPLVAAVFARTGAAEGGQDRRLPRIPVSIADLGLRRTNPVAEVLLELLELAGDRLSASWLLDFLSLEPVRARWSLDDDDIADLRLLVRESGLRWGFDAADRARVGQPALDQNTVRFALERLALGVLMPDESPLTVVEGPGGALGPAVPLEVESRDRARRVGQLAAILRALEAHRSAMRQPTTLAGWRDRLLSALDDMAAASEQASWLRSEVDGVLIELARVGEALGEVEVDRAAVLRWLQGGFEMTQRGDRPITGAVQVCSLEPMRSVPFRVVALLGMDDRAFPRGGRARTWDPMAERRPGERDRREIDRHLMLEAVLSAREALVVSWSGRDVQQGRELPAAVPVEELIEVLSSLTGSNRRELVREHGLQPWSPGGFGSAGVGYDAGMARAAERLREIAAGEEEPSSLGLAASGDAPLPAEQWSSDTLGLDELAVGLLAPHKLLLRDRLRLSVSWDEGSMEDREPLELDTLEAWSLRARIVEHLFEGDVDWTDEAITEALHRRLSGEGLLPLRAGGRAILAAEVEKARRLLANVAEVDGSPREGVELSVLLTDGPLLTGRVSDVLERDGELLLQWRTPSSSANERLRLTAWIHLLAATASGVPVAGARLVGYGSAGNSKRSGGDFLRFDGDAERARDLLQDLVGVWRAARERPVPLFRKTSLEAAGALVRCGGDLEAPGARSALASAVARGWSGGFRSSGDVEDPWIRTFFVDYDPVDHLDERGPGSLVDLAQRVWEPIVVSLQQGSALAAGWLVGVDR